MNGDRIHGREVEDDFFTRFDPDWWNDGTGDDDLTCLQLLAENGEQVGGVTNDVDEFAGQVLQALGFVDAGNFSSVAEDAGGQAWKNAAASRWIAAAKNDVSLIYVASKRSFNVVGGMINIGDFDGRAQSGNGGFGCVAVRTRRQVLAKMHGDFGLSGWFRPTGQRKHRAGGRQRAIGEKAEERRVDVQPLEGRGTAKRQFPAESFVAGIEELSTTAELRGHSARDARVFPSCGHEERAMRSSVAFGRNFVASGFERARAAPAPDEDHVCAAGVVETVPMAARRENHITLA
jgi:hypothetical protein